MMTLKEQQRLIETCSNTTETAYEPNYPEGRSFCPYCGAQFRDRDHGSKVRA